MIQRPTPILFVLLLSLFTMCKGQSNSSQVPYIYLFGTPPSLTPEIFSPGFISTYNFHEFSCCFSPDGKEFYFVRDRKLLYTYVKNDQWTVSAEVEICKGHFCKEPHISRDNKTLYFGSKQIENGIEKNGIWKAERMQEGWSKPVFVGEGTFVTSTMKGDVYFGYDDGTHQSNKIIKAKVIDNKFYERQIVFTSDDFPSPDHFAIMHPCIASGESFIIFSAYRKGMWGKACDLFVCFKDNGVWSNPIILDERINTGFAMVPSLSPDEKYLFFLRDGDIWWVNIRAVQSAVNAD